MSRAPQVVRSTSSCREYFQMAREHLELLGAPELVEYLQSSGAIFVSLGRSYLVLPTKQNFLVFLPYLVL